MGLNIKRRIGEAIIINDDITIVLTHACRSTASLKIIAPSHVKILRAELKDRHRCNDEDCQECNCRKGKQ